MNAAGYREDILREFHRTKGLADRAMAQITDEQFFAAPGSETNPIAIVVKHVAGNLRSRWTDFRTSDGEKPDRHRDQEFEDVPMNRAKLLDEWEDGWRRVFAALDPLTDADLDTVVYIRQEPHSIYKAISRQVAHYAGHAYQILFIAKHLKGADWQTLSVPRGKSEEFNQRMMSKARG